MTDPAPARLRDAYPYNDSSNAMELATADRRFEQLIERRERLIERSRFGILALNGASAIGILSSYHGLRSELGIDPRWALAAFGVGMMLALLSIFFETIFVGNRAAHMFGHLSLLRRMRATLDNHLSEQSDHSFHEQLEELGERGERGSLTKIYLDDSKDGLPNDFCFSPVALGTLNFAGGAWIAGVSVLLFALFV
jgi:hypothetical protein